MIDLNKQVSGFRCQVSGDQDTPIGVQILVWMPVMIILFGVMAGVM